MNRNLKNRYFFLRHGQNIHQTALKNIVYCWPDDDPPCALIKEGIEEAKRAGEFLKDKHIDHIFSSDALRCRQTAKIVAERINYDNIIYDTRLRDINWGIFCGKTKQAAWEFYNGNAMTKFKLAVPGGESWNDCTERMVKVLSEIESEFENKIILLVSHGDPLWLLQGYINGLNNEELLIARENIIKPGEVREIYE